MSLKIKNSLIGGVLFSCVVTVVLFLFSGSGKGLVSSLLLAAFINFLLYLSVSCAVEKCNKKVQVLSKVILEIPMILMFVSVSVSSIASQMLFYPHFDEDSYHQLVTDRNAQELNIIAEGENISGWGIFGIEENAPIVLYFGGNGENASTRVLRLLKEEKEREPFEKCNFIFFDYPGYGKSSGMPSEASLKEYGTSAYHWVKNNYPDSKIIIMGFSIGTGVANYVASTCSVDGLILMAPYADGYDLYNNQVGIFYGPLRLLVAYKMEAVNFADNISVCPLIFASDKDEMIPYESSQKLAGKYPYNSRFITIEGISHNDFWENENVLKSIDDYMGEVLEP